MAAISVVIFDLDDTLYSEADYVRSGYRATAECLMGPDYDAEQVYKLLWEAFEQGPRDRVFNTVLAKMGVQASESQIAALVGVYRGHRPTIKLTDDMRDFLTALRRDYKLGLITDGYLPAQRYKVEALRLGPLLDHIIYTEELGRTYWKPATKAFEMTAEYFGVEPGQCVYVADNVSKDFVGPNRLGWLTAQIKRPDRIHGDVAPPPDGQAKHIITKIEEIRELL